MGLRHRRDFEIPKLTPIAQREDFIVWRDHFEEFLEHTPGWSGVSQALAKIWEHKVEATVDVVNIPECHEHVRTVTGPVLSVEDEAEC